MSVTEPRLDKILEDVEKLTPQDKVRLIQRVAEKILPLERPTQQRMLVRGKYKSDFGTTEEDFKRVEWRVEDGEAEIDSP